MLGKRWPHQATRGFLRALELLHVYQLHRHLHPQRLADSQVHLHIPAATHTWRRHNLLGGKSSASDGMQTAVLKALQVNQASARAEHDDSDTNGSGSCAAMIRSWARGRLSAGLSAPWPCLRAPGPRPAHMRQDWSDTVAARCRCGGDANNEQRDAIALPVVRTMGTYEDRPTHRLMVKKPRLHLLCIWQRCCDTQRKVNQQCVAQ